MSDLNPIHKEKDIDYLQVALDNEKEIELNEVKAYNHTLINSSIDKLEAVSKTISRKNEKRLHKIILELNDIANDIKKDI